MATTKRVDKARLTQELVLVDRIDGPLFGHKVRPAGQGAEELDGSRDGLDDDVGASVGLVLQ